MRRQHSIIWVSTLPRGAFQNPSPVLVKVIAWQTWALVLSLSEISTLLGLKLLAFLAKRVPSALLEGF